MLKKKNNKQLESFAVILSNKQYEIYQDLYNVVKMIRNESSVKLTFGYLYKYYNIVYSYFDDIVYFVEKFSRSVLDDILLDSEIDFIIAYINN